MNQVVLVLEAQYGAEAEQQRSRTSKGAVSSMVQAKAEAAAAAASLAAANQQPAAAAEQQQQQ
jgi:hypothetical protein